MVSKELQYWVGFNIIPGIGRVKISQIENHFGSLENAWKGTPGDFKKAGLDSGSIQAIENWRPQIDLPGEMAKLEKARVRVLNFHDGEYPARLKEIYDFPPVIYIKGDWQPADETCLAVVGTRRATVYGRQVTEELVEDLVQSGFTIVSGLARGIDTIAHRRALDKDGRTAAVLACGLDTIYPAENAPLAARVAEKGALISEYPLGARPRPDNFPRRNRIMSGMSLGVLVVEADESSGAVITAHMASEQNREVFAVPGSILSPMSRGTNTLIQEGAKLVRKIEDILVELNMAPDPHQLALKEAENFSETENQLLKELSSEPTHIDLVCRNSGLPVALVSSNLAIMEIKGLVKQVSAMNYVLTRRTR